MIRNIMKCHIDFNIAHDYQYLFLWIYISYVDNCNENGILREINHLFFLLSFPQCPHFIPEIISQSNAIRQQHQKKQSKNKNTNRVP